jgi:hypothetical protein
MIMQPKVRRAVLSVLLITAAAACYDAATRPTAPTVAPTTISATATVPRPAASSQQSGNNQVAQCDPRPALVSRGVFGPAGGTLVIGGSRLLIPAGALSVTVPIEASTPGDSTSEVDFKPHGLKFAKAATLVLQGDGCNVGELPPRIVYIGPNGGVQQTIPATRDAYNNVIAPIAHFSGYAIAF